MALQQAIEQAFRTAKERNWDTTYWLVDLHGVVLNSTYTAMKHEVINADVIAGLKEISLRPDCCLILWSSTSQAELQHISDWLVQDHGIEVMYINENPEVRTSPTSTGDFSAKPYFNVLLDDKAGFDPSQDWAMVVEVLKMTPILVSAPSQEMLQADRITKLVEQVVEALNKSYPCPHENAQLNLGDGKTWARCDDCSVTFQQANWDNAKRAASRQEDAIFAARSLAEIARSVSAPLKLHSK